jgi:hypothetical protein
VLIRDLSIAGQGFLPQFITDALIDMPAQEDYASLIRQVREELDMDVDILPVEAEYEEQENRVAELAAVGEV